MRQTVFQRAELRDENDNIIQQGTYGKGSALSNSTNDAWIDYVMNNLEALRSMSVGAVIPVETLPESGETGKAYVVTTGTDAGKLFMWDGEDWVEITGSIGDYLPITGGTITGNLSVTGNATLSGTSTAVTPAVDDNSTKVATTEYVQNNVKPIETDVTINDKRISNIEKLLQGNLYDYQADSTEAYTKTVPSGAMPYAGLEKVGGKTIVYNQLCGNAELPTGITYTDGGTYTINTTYDSVKYPKLTSIKTIVGHKYYASISRNVLTPEIWLYNVYNGIELRLENDTQYTMESISTATGENQMFLRCAVGTYNAVVTCKCIDLTLAFGAGNEPTIEQIHAMFPAESYPYNAGTLLSAGVTEVVSKDGNNSTLQTYSIPASIQALEGYGWSAGTAYNYIDIERKKFVKCVDRVDLGTLNYNYYASGTNLARFVGSGFSIKAPATEGDKANTINVRYPTVSYTEFVGGTVDKIMWGYINTGLIGFKDTSYTDPTTFKNSLSGVYLYYELSTPIEMDISEYLTDDNLIQVEVGGTLTFPNQHGDDYRLPVPSEETYMIDLQEAINNG